MIGLWVQTKPRLAVLLAALFAFNLLETQLEEHLKSPEGYRQGYQIAEAFAALEGSIRFDLQAPPALASVGMYSFAYFFLFPALLLAIAWACWKQNRIGPFRVFALSLTFNYLLSLPFFLFFPVPERWAFPGSNTLLLSDLLSTRLIEMVRPISGLDNCFPSIHVSFSLLLVLLAYHFRFRFRHGLLCLALTVVASTFVLGIHWLPDLAMGGVMALLAFAGAVAADRRYGEAPEAPAVEEETPATSTRPVEVPSPERPGGVSKQVFISYRRENGAQMARVVHSELERRGLTCFLDVDDLGAEHFDERLLQEIERTPNFVVILSPGSLDRCHSSNDWLRREIAWAIAKRRNIVPLMMKGFHFPEPEEMPEDLRDLIRHNGVVYSHEYFSATFDKLQSFLTPKASPGSREETEG